MGSGASAQLPSCDCEQLAQLVAEQGKAFAECRAMVLDFGLDGQTILALSDADLESVAEEMGMPLGRRKVLLAKLKAARAAPTPTPSRPLSVPMLGGPAAASAPKPVVPSLSNRAERNSFGPTDNDSDDENLANFASPTPSYGAAISGKGGLGLSIPMMPGKVPSGLPPLKASLDARPSVPSMDALPLGFKSDAQRDSINISNARMRKKKQEVEEVLEEALATHAGSSSGEIERIVRGFQLVADENGLLNRETFATCLHFFRESGLSSIAAMAKSDLLSVRLFDVFDIDGNGEIDLKEFTVGLVCLVTGDKRDKLKSLFQICDVDASGEIDEEEFFTLLKFLHVEIPRAHSSLKYQGTTENDAAVERLTDTQLKEMATIIVHKLDIDGNGQISLDELMAWFDEHPESDVTDLFTLLNEIIDSAEGVDAAHFTTEPAPVKRPSNDVKSTGMPALKMSMSQSETHLPSGDAAAGGGGPSLAVGKLALNKAPSAGELDAPQRRRVDEMHVENVLGKMVNDYSAREGYSMGEIEKMVKGFRLLANENGGLTKDTFGLALAFFDQKAGYESISAMAKSRDLSDHLFDVFDSDGNGEIDLNEFTVGLLSLVTGSKRDKVRALFQLIDLDASGAIDHGEFYQLLHFLHVELPKAQTALAISKGGETEKIAHMSDEELNKMAGAIISKLDVDGDGEISLDELMIWMDKYPDADVTDLFTLLRSVVESK